MRAPERTFRLARSLRRELTLPEVVLWERLRGGRLGGLRFRRQHPIGPYVLDFYCPASKIAVEVDGAAHDFAERVAHDERRTKWLAGRDVAVMRVAATDVLNDEALGAVLEAIAAACQR